MHIIPVPAPTAPSATSRRAASASARPASAASTCTTRASLSQLSSHSRDDRDDDVVDADARVGRHRGGHGAVEDAPDRHRGREVDRRLDHAPLGHLQAADHLARAVEHRDAGGQRLGAQRRPGAAGTIAVTPVRATPRPAGGSGSSRTTVTWPTPHAGDVGDRVGRPGLELADRAGRARAGCERRPCAAATLTRYGRAPWPSRCPSSGAIGTDSTTRAARSGSACAPPAPSCPARAEAIRGRARRRGRAVRRRAGRTTTTRCSPSTTRRCSTLPRAARGATGRRPG